MAVKLGRRPVPSSAQVLAKEAERFLVQKGILADRVHRVEPVAEGITWLLFVTSQHKARYAIVAGEGPASWEFVNEGSGWPVL